MRTANTSTPAKIAPNALPDLDPGVGLTESGDVASDWAGAHSPYSNVSDSEAVSSLVSASHADGSASRPKATGVKQTLKRTHNDSGPSSIAAPAKKVRKRVRTTALQRQAPTARTELPLGNGELA